MCHNAKIALHEVIENRKIAKNMYLLSVKYAGLEKSRSGRFYMISPENSNNFLSRPISLFSESSEGNLTFYYLVKGSGTEALARLKVGEMALVQGPLGNSFSKTNGRVLLVAGGVGIAPFYSLIESFERQVSFDLLVGSKSAEGLEIIKEFSQLSEDFKERVSVATDDGSLGKKGFVTELVEEFLEKKQYDSVIICGPMVMMKAVSELCYKKGVHCVVSLEEAMACGVGACVGCSIKTPSKMKRVCKEGPIFDASEVFYE